MERTFPGGSDFTACIFRGTVKIWGIARIVSMTSYGQLVRRGCDRDGHNRLPDQPFALSPLEDRARRRHRLPHHALARFGDRNAAGRSIEQADSQPFLDCPDAVAERTFRDAQLRRGLCEAALLGNSDKGTELGETVFSHRLIQAFQKLTRLMIGRDGRPNTCTGYGCQC